MIRLSLRMQVVLGLCLSFLTVIVGTGLYFSVTIYTTMTHEYESKGQAIAMSVAQTATEAILNEDPAALQGMIDSLLTIGGVSYVLIQNHENQIICHTFSPAIPSEIRSAISGTRQASSFKIQVGQGSFWHIYAPILNGEIGAISIGMDLSPVTHQAIFAILKQGALVCGICCVTLLGMVILLRRLTRPLVAITRYATDLAGHDFVTLLPNGPEITRLPGYPQPEVKALVDSFIKLETELTANLTELESSLKIQEKLQSELSIAADIQASLLPTHTHSEFESALVTHFIKPARDVGGDFVDYFVLHHRYLVNMVGDVSGKGVSAAMIMATVMTMIRSTAQSVASPAEILTIVNQDFSRRNVNEMFVTVFLSVLDMHTGELRYANAGHNYPYRDGANGHWVPFGQELDLVLGIDEACFYREHVTTLASNESIFIYTDGITEAMTSDGDLFGDDRLLATLNETKDCAQLIADISQAVTAFSGSAPQSDDQTLLHIHYVGVPSILNGPELSFYFENTIDSISKLADVVAQFGQANGLPQSTVMSLNLVLEELIANTIYYGYDDHDTHHIYTHLLYDTDTVTAVVTDDGRPFNPLDAPEVDIDTVLDDRGIGGLGIHFVKSLAKELVYERTGDTNRITIVMEVIS